MGIKEMPVLLLQCCNSKTLNLISLLPNFVTIARNFYLSVFLRQNEIFTLFSSETPVS
jgi:hypothetical protein